MPAMPHPDFSAPEKQTTIWRYMDFAKFLAMLENSALHMTSIAALSRDDPYEGQLTNLQARLLSDLDSAPTSEIRRTLGLQPSTGNEGAHSFLRSFRRLFVDSRVILDSIFVNCWHMNSSESDAMWRLYSLQGQGIAVQSSYDRLERSLHMALQELQIGVVNYHDYDSHSMQLGNIFFPAMSKRTSFDHEKELRIATLRIADNEHPNPIGISVTCDVEILIEKVLISPRSPVWNVDLVKSLLRRYRLNPNLATQSNLYTRDHRSAT